MKRRIFTQATLTTLLLAAGCSAPDRTTAPQPTRTAGWVTPPMIESAHRTVSGLTINGRATPLGRVVLRGAGETAYATGADPQGRFQLRIQAPAADTLFVVEAMEGQEASPAPYRLFASRDPQGPIALLAAGAPTRRLDPGGVLDVIDSDGGALAASGRATPGRMVPVAVAGRPAIQARTGSDGRWSVVLDSTASTAAAVMVGDRTYAYPGPEGGGSGLVVQRTPGGWRLSWPLSPQSRQSSWFPSAG